MEIAIVLAAADIGEVLLIIGGILFALLLIGMVSGGGRNFQTDPLP
jgi:hypothetical protein